jgi:hypothetical protein
MKNQLSLMLQMSKFNSNVEAEIEYWSRIYLLREPPMALKIIYTI